MPSAMSSDTVPSPTGSSASPLLGLWSGRRWGQRRKRVLDAEAHSFHARGDR